MIKVGADYQIVSILIGIGCSLTIAAYVARKYDVLKNYFPHEKAHLAGDTIQNFALIAYVALPFFRSLIQIEPIGPLQIVCHSLVILGAFGLGEAAFVVATGGVEKNNPVCELLNVATKIVNMSFLYWGFQQKALRKYPALILVLHYYHDFKSMLSTGVGTFGNMSTRQFK